MCVLGLNSCGGRNWNSNFVLKEGEKWMDKKEKEAIYWFLGAGAIAFIIGLFLMAYEIGQRLDFVNKNEDKEIIEAQVISVEKHSKNRRYSGEPSGRSVSFSAEIQYVKDGISHTIETENDFVSHKALKDKIYIVDNSDKTPVYKDLFLGKFVPYERTNRIYMFGLIALNMGVIFIYMSIVTLLKLHENVWIVGGCVINTITSGVIAAMTLTDYDYMCLCAGIVEFILGIVICIALLKSGKKKKVVEEVTN